MACCQEYSVVWTHKTPYRYGYCTPTELWVWTNPEVSERCVSANNVLLKLNAEAVRKISAAFVGRPLRVAFSGPCCSCCHCCDCFSCCACGCDCTPKRVQRSAFNEIWFVNESEKPIFSGIMSCLCNALCGPCVMCVNSCKAKTVKIPYGWVTQPGESELTPNMQSVQSQPGLQEVDRRPLMNAQY